MEFGIATEIWEREIKTDLTKRKVKEENQKMVSVGDQVRTDEDSPLDSFPVLPFGLDLIFVLSLAPQYSFNKNVAESLFRSVASIRIMFSLMGPWNAIIIE